MSAYSHPQAGAVTCLVPYGAAVEGAFGTPRALGDPFAAIAAAASVVGGLFGSSSEAKARKEEAKAQRYAADLQFRAVESTIAGQTEQARIMADAYRYGTDAQMSAAKAAAEYSFRAAKAKSDADLAAVQEQYGAALSALRQQRLAAIDTQAAQLVQNTSGAMFALSSQGLTEAGSVARTYPRWGAGALVALAAVTLYAISRGKGKKRSLKFRGHEYAAEPA